MSEMNNIDELRTSRAGGNAVTRSDFVSVHDTALTSPSHALIQSLSVSTMADSSPTDVPVLTLQGFLLLSFLWFSYTTWKTFKPRNEHSLRSVAILVLGDIGRSPRMMYHAQSFAEIGFVTDIIGYGGKRHVKSLRQSLIVFDRFKTYTLTRTPTQSANAIPS